MRNYVIHGRNLILKKHGLALLTCTFLTGALFPLCAMPSSVHAATTDDEWGVKNPYLKDVPVITAPEAQMQTPMMIPPTIMDSVKIADPVPNYWDGKTESGQPQTEEPVDLEADNLINDEGTQIVAAIGNVEMVQGGRVLKADKVSYNLRTDQVRATGNVVMSEADGTTYFADDVELTQDMKNGFVKGLQILLADGSRFTAQDGTRVGGTKLILKQASYTPCEPCKEDPTKPPLWQIRAADVVHDETEKKISYHDAWFEFAGVPVAYTPYFSHPDGSEKQKSGFLMPTVGYDSELGASYQQEYYWAIGPDKDMTVGAIIPTVANPVALAEYRERFENAEIAFSGSGTISDRQDSKAGRTVTLYDEKRGHLFGEGQWDMNENWRSGFNVAVTSDDQYLRQYNIDSKDVLENEIYAERFEDRNYMVGRMMAFQDVRVSRRQVDQPAVLPEVIASFYGAPNDLLGGRWNANVSALGLYRDGSGQDVARGTAELGWQRRYITGFGLVNKLDALLRGDVYNVQQRDALLSDPSEDDSTQTRGFAQANWEVSYPFVKRLEASQITLAPVVSLTAGSNVDYDENEGIPNEDSQDFILDPTNIFEANRFPGYDRIEDRSHATYGLRTGWYGDNGYRGEVFFGQSHRFDEDDNPFNSGSGLSDQNSDYVGQVTASLSEYLNLDYRIQLNSDDFSSERHDLDAIFSWDPVQLGVRYFYANALDNTDLDQPREQIRPSARLRFYKDWYLSGDVWYELADDNHGLRRATYGINYLGQCMTFALVAERTLTEDATGDSENEIMMRIGFKNLGEFTTSGISVGGNNQND